MGKANHRRGEEQQREDREGLETGALLLLASSQRFFCETRGPAYEDRPLLNFRSLRPDLTISRLAKSCFPSPLLSIKG